MRILVCGGAGYIGSHMCKLIAAHGYELAIIDDLSTGHREALKYGRFFEGCISDDGFVDRVFKEFKPDSIIHFAAKSLVAESVLDPALYYRGNVIASLKFLEHVRKSGCPIVFSSTAAIFGTPRSELIDEDHPQQPLNTYGRTKAIIENALAEYWKAYSLASVSLRYFNAAGADVDGELGEAHEPESHLIPRALESAMGRCSAVYVYGNDYDTPDGTCIRDYIHVNDLCTAHLQALNFVSANPGAHYFNLGNGNGFSVNEVLAAVEKVINRKLAIETAGRRAGDPARLVANSSAAHSVLGWVPEVPSIEQIIETAWRWHSDRRY